MATMIFISVIFLVAVYLCYRIAGWEDCWISVCSHLGLRDWATKKEVCDEILRLKEKANAD